MCTFSVSTSTDDAGRNPFGTCPYATNFNEIYFGKCPNGQGITSGFRFPNVTISPGASIAEAYLEFTVDGPYTLSITVAFYGQAAGNALPFSSSSCPENRPLTQASALWTIPASDRWELNQVRRSPDLTTIVQEIINRPDWSSGNALAIITQNASPGLGNGQHRRVIGIDRPPSTYSGFVPRLVVKLATAREPVILLPGVGGSEFNTTAQINLSVNNGHGGTWTHTYPANEKVWINRQELLDVFDQEDDYFDILKLEMDGITPVATAITVTNIVTTVEILGPFNLEVYAKWRPFFESQGYQYGVDLFEFPYDFRKDIKVTATDLDTMVHNALVAANGGQTDESQWAITRVNLISHSMGSKVVREYIRDPLRAQRVHRIIALGPAYLGAPNFLKALLFGDDFGTKGLLNKGELKDIIGLTQN